MDAASGRAVACNQKMRILAPFLLFCSFFLSSGSPLLAAKLFDKSAKKRLTVYLDEICQWIIAEGVSPTQAAGGAKDQGSVISVEGNLARVLIAGFELTKNQRSYLDGALKWCDHFVGQQQRTKTSGNNEAGFWLDHGAIGNLDLAAAGTAAAALARSYIYVDGQRRKDYLQALERYALFLQEGCASDPQGMGREGTQSWVIKDGADRGATGHGYYPDRASTKPSTHATAANSLLFAQLHAITGNKRYRDLAAEGVRWIVRLRKPIGEIPLLVDGEESNEFPLATIALCTQAFLSADYLLQDSGLNEMIAKEVEPVVRRLIRVQNEKGTWGEGVDEQSSSGAAALLAWFYLNTTADEAIPQSLERFWQIFLNPVHSQSFGVQMRALPSALVGLTTAEMIKPGITFKKL